MDALTVDGHRALGWPDAGRIAVGQRADLVAVRLDSPRTAGCAPAQLVMAAGAADVHTWSSAAGWWSTTASTCSATSAGS